MDKDVGIKEEEIAVSWAMQEILQEVQVSLDLLNEAREETNHLLERLLRIMELS